MSRTRKAIISASFGYTQFALAMMSGILLVPLILSRLETRTYGLWLATGELLAYTAILDLGVFTVLPWMVAEADGRKDNDAIRSLIIRGLLIGLCVGLGFILVFAVLWWLTPSLLKLTELDRATLKGPLMLLVIATALVYPLKVFSATLVGLQDVAFNGVLVVVQLSLNIGLTLVLLLKGYGLYSLAAAAAIPQILTMGASGLRLRMIAPGLLKGWQWPSLSGLRLLFSQSLGVWLGGFGWQLAAASSGLIITYLGHPEWVPIYVCTAKLSQLLMQMCWMLPDSGLVGLAQLHGEGKMERVRYVVGTMLKLHLILSSAAACLILALNPLFVRLWVGTNLFGGLSLNALMAIGLIWLSWIHGLVGSTAVVGNRLRVGIATMLNGVLHVALALMLGARWGLKGIVVASLVSGTLTTLPLGSWLLKLSVGLDFRWTLRHIWLPWFIRVVPLLAIAAVLGSFYMSISFWLSVVLGMSLEIIYLWWMRPLYQSLPLDPRLRRWLVTFRLVPTTVTATPPMRGML
jgi:O-antigen/teichoic acid export membrane protein